MKYIPYILTLTIFLSAGHPVHARQPILEQGEQVTTQSEPKDVYISAQPVVDPTTIELGIHGNIQKSNEIDLYVFKPLKDANVPFEILVPAKESLKNFRPTLFLIGKNLPPVTSEEYPVSIPLGLEASDIPSPMEKRTPHFDLDSLGMYFRGTLRTIPLTANTIYFLVVADPYGRTGPYAIHLGNKTDNTEGIELTAPQVDPETIIFDDSGARNLKAIEGPSTFEKQFFGNRTSPFQNWDSKLRLWTDKVRFILYRLTHLI